MGRARGKAEARVQVLYGLSRSGSAGKSLQALHRRAPAAAASTPSLRTPSSAPSPSRSGADDLGGSARRGEHYRLAPRTTEPRAEAAHHSREVHGPGGDRRAGQKRGGDRSAEPRKGRGGTKADGLPSLKLPQTQCGGAVANSNKLEEFSWVLQKGPREIFRSPESELSARGVGHRSELHFRREVARHTNALSNNTSTRQEAFKSYACRAFAFSKLGKDEKALADYTEAIRNDPTNGSAYFNRSLALTKVGHYDLAIRDLTTAIEIDPSNARDYLHNRALLYRKVGHFGQAMADYESSEQLRLRKLGSRRQRTQARPVDKPSPIRGTADFAKLLSLNSDGHRASLPYLLHAAPMARDPTTLNNIADHLSELVAFKSVPRELLLKLSHFAKHVSVEAEGYVFREGDIGSDLYVIIKGWVTVRKKAEPKSVIAFVEQNEIRDLLQRGSEDVVVAKLHAGVSFGEIGDDEPEAAPTGEESSNAMQGGESESESEARNTAGREVPRADAQEPVSPILSEPSASEETDNENMDEDAVGDLAATLAHVKCHPRRARQLTVRETRRRRATIRAEQNSEFLKFETSATTNKVLNEYRAWQIADRMIALRKSAIFNGWPEEKLEKLAKRAMVQQFAPGTELIKQGDVVNDFFVLRVGLCKVLKSVDVSRPPQRIPSHPTRSNDYESIVKEAKNMGDIKGQQTTGDWKIFELGVITGGQVAGEFAVLENNHRIHSLVTVRATTIVDALVIAREDIAPLLSDFYGDCMSRIRKSLHVTSMSSAKVNMMFSSLRNWGVEKAKIVKESVVLNNRLRRAEEDAKREDKLA